MMSNDMQPRQSESYSWIETWIKALTQPNEAAYDRIINDPNASTQRAYLWMAINSLVGYLIGSTIFSLFNSSPDGGMRSALGGGIVTILCFAPFVAALAVVGLAIMAGISNLVAKALGGTGNYSQLVYAFAAYLAPLGIISSVISSVPVVQCLAAPLSLYSLYLNILSVKAVHKFGWGKAFVSSVVILVGLFTLIAFCVVIFLALMGPAIGSVFSNIIEGITTP